MKAEKITVELTLGVSDETAVACTVILNHYLRNHPGMDVDLTTAEGAGDTLCREIHLRKAEP
jgi:hypothetical protein